MIDVKFKSGTNGLNEKSGRRETMIGNYMSCKFCGEEHETV